MSGPFDLAIAVGRISLGIWTPVLKDKGGGHCVKSSSCFFLVLGMVWLTPLRNTLISCFRPTLASCTLVFPCLDCGHMSRCSSTSVDRGCGVGGLRRQRLCYQQLTVVMYALKQSVVNVLEPLRKFNQSSSRAVNDCRSVKTGNWFGNRIICWRLQTWACFTNILFVWEADVHLLMVNISPEDIDF
jgi:hypothetical protein